MLKVALIGAPTSGKTALAHQLSQALSPRSVEIVDDYVPELQERTGLVFGHYATYLGNLQCACARHEAEMVARQKDVDVVITCGTVIENSIYTAVHAFIESSVNGENAAATAITNRRAYIAMTWLAIMAHDLWDYDLAYYLPLKDGDDETQAVEAHIIESIDAFNLTKRVTTLAEPAAALATVVQHVVEREGNEATASE